MIACRGGSLEHVLKIRCVRCVAVLACVFFQAGQGLWRIQTCGLRQLKGRRLSGHALTDHVPSQGAGASGGGGGGGSEPGEAAEAPVPVLTGLVRVRCRDAGSAVEVSVRPCCGAPQHRAREDCPCKAVSRAEAAAAGRAMGAQGWGGEQRRLRVTGVWEDGLLAAWPL